MLDGQIKSERFKTIILTMGVKVGGALQCLGKYFIPLYYYFIYLPFK